MDRLCLIFYIVFITISLFANFCMEVVTFYFAGSSYDVGFWEIPSNVIVEGKFLDSHSSLVKQQELTESNQYFKQN